MIESIEYNGFTFDSTGATIQSVSGNGMPAVRSAAESMSQEHGAVASGYLYDARTIGWSGDLTASSASAYMTLRKNLMQALSPTTLQGDDMVFTLIDSTTRTLRDVVLVDQNLDLPSDEPSRTWNSYTLTFRAHFPFFEGTEHNETQDRTVISGGGAIPATVPMSLAATTTTSSDPLTVTNDGNAPAYPIFTVVGAGTTFTITNTTNSQQMVIDTTLSASQSIVIDVRNKTATVDGTSIISAVSGEWITLDAGDNTLSFSVDSGYTSNTRLDTTFYDTYFGI